MTDYRDTRNFDAWRDLMAAVIVQAVRDTKDEQPEKAIDAVLFLTGDDAPMWFEAVGMDEVNTLKFLTSGRAQRLPMLKRGNK